MNDLNPASSFQDAARPKEKLEIDAATLAWFKERGASWREEIEGVLDFYINTVEQPASEFEPGEMDPEPPGPA
jgi:uncharacterized protein (DUF4415 family)